MNRPLVLDARVLKLGAIANQIEGFAHGQCVFVVMSDRSKTSQPLFVSIGKGESDGIARWFQTQGYPTACVRVGHVSGQGQVTTI